MLGWLCRLRVFLGRRVWRRLRASWVLGSVVGGSLTIILRIPQPDGGSSLGGPKSSRSRRLAQLPDQTKQELYEAWWQQGRTRLNTSSEILMSATLLHRLLWTDPQS